MKPKCIGRACPHMEGRINHAVIKHLQARRTPFPGGLFLVPVVGINSASLLVPHSWGWWFTCFAYAFLFAKSEESSACWQKMWENT